MPTFSPNEQWVDGGRIDGWVGATFFLLMVLNFHNEPFFCVARLRPVALTIFFHSLFFYTQFVLSDAQAQSSKAFGSILTSS